MLYNMFKLYNRWLYSKVLYNMLNNLSISHGFHMLLKQLFNMLN